MPQKRNLPIGIQAFDKLRRGGHYYVDKTPHLLRLVSEGGYFFLSRPRRFGKSLLLDTLRCLFEGRQDLFEGLFIRERCDWQVRHPVIRLSFADGVLTTREALDVQINELLRAEASRLERLLTENGGCMVIQTRPDPFGDPDASREYAASQVLLVPLGRSH